MIDEKINTSLIEIERELQNISSARRQVDKTVASYEELKVATASYKDSLNQITKSLTDLVANFRTNYEEIMKASSSAIKNLNEAADSVKKEVGDKVSSLDNRLYIILAMNAILIAITIALHFIK